jgi:3-oxoacyl-[acyl-carrier protein] reductase
VRAAFAWQGRVDTWINNAGADVLTTQLKSSSFDNKLERLLQVDLLGTIRLSRLVADRLVAQSQSEKSKPSIINIGWDQAATGMEGEPGQLFCTTKAAVEAFSKALALTIGPYVRVNTVAPGWIKTKWGENIEGYWNHRAQAESILERWGHPDDVAAAIGWLASSNAEFVNAQTLRVNGGFRNIPIAPAGN